MIEREQLIEIVVSVSTVILMLGAMMSIGNEYGANNSNLSPEGGQLLVFSIIGFILLLTIVGFVLAFVMNDADDGLETDGDSDAQSSA
ncbi:DUF7472 family protein [Natronorubrum sulfidifaciens]|uniref:Uncharacterized protein n=1 Tax=Natronorubrum sulfidifaciens JCM 14089 TaxID=1230460 RepID=L9WEP9_9EURY|nr:hypothetical protein [Natronorubrum sulfidifaciens]ELY46788.1 hypothetical protein C495_06758 [Natronorubrum sulfidifaciens JCM 14089]